LIVVVFIIDKLNDACPPPVKPLMPKTLVNLDLDLVRTFVTIATLRSFTRAAERLMRQQSTISLQIRRLEDTLGRRLLERTPRSVTLTPAGEAFLADAQRMLDLNDDVVARAAEPAMHGTVRLGTPEDFATQHLPQVLARFAAAYPGVALDVTCDLTLTLIERFRQGHFDLMLYKRTPKTGTAGQRVWREPLVWVRGERHFEDFDAAIPLVVSPEPCVYRQRATTALTSAKRPFRIAYTCASLAGSVAAVQAGLGIAVLPKGMVPLGLHAIDGGPLPDLADTEISLVASRSLSLPARKLKEHIVRSLG
jgi:DNA-binding transcriptional LysR family regulator